MIGSTLEMIIMEIWIFVVQLMMKFGLRLVWYIAKFIRDQFDINSN